MAATSVAAISVFGTHENCERKASALGGQHIIIGQSYLNQVRRLK